MDGNYGQVDVNGFLLRLNMEVMEKLNAIKPD